jgi:hypothetical protein
MKLHHTLLLIAAVAVIAGPAARADRRLLARHARTLFPEVEFDDGTWAPRRKWRMPSAFSIFIHVLLLGDMWKPFQKSTNNKAPRAAILFDKFHILEHLGEALDKVRKQKYARLEGDKRKFIKGQKYALLSHKENLRGSGQRKGRPANKCLHR